MMQMIKYTLPETNMYPTNQKVQDLLQTLSHRDSEIRKSELAGESNYFILRRFVQMLQIFCQNWYKS